MQFPRHLRLDAHVQIGVHEHAAVLYRGRPSAFRLASFLGEGIANNELCIYLAPRSFHDEMFESLRGLGHDVAHHLETGTLRVHEGDREFSGLRDWTNQVFNEAENRRAPMIRWLEEGLWPGALGFQQASFFEFHALLNYQVKQYPSVVLCQYDLEQVEPSDLFRTIAVHRHLILDGILVRDNPFYMPAEKFIPSSPEERERDLLRLYRELGFDVEKLLATLIGYSKLRHHAQGIS